MTDANNLPDGGTGEYDGLADIIDDPVGDNVTDDGTAADDALSDDNLDAPDKGAKDEPDDDVDEDAEDPDKAATEEDQGQLRDAKGRFLSDEDKVRLADGTTTTVKELKDGWLRQGDYTRKTQEVARERDEVKAARERSNQQAQQLEQQLAVNLQWLQLTKPARPEVSYEEDPVAHIRYRDESDRWNEAYGWVMQNLNHHKAQFEAQQKEQLTAYERREDEALRSAIPALRDPAKFRAFVAEVEKIAPEYGITSEELKGVKDHRQWLVLRDALAYRRMKARTPEVRKAIEGKPPVVQSGKRPNPKQNQQRAKQARTERLRTTGSFDDGVAALMELPDL